MISIEKDAINKQRFEFNLPFKCIDIMYGNSNEELPKIDWNYKTIIWLDYDGKISLEILTDIKLVTSKLISGSVIIVSVNAEPDIYDKDIEERLDCLKSTLGKDKVPYDIKASELSGWGFAKVLRRIINNEIEETLSGRNGGLHDLQKLTYNQVFNFNYDDGAKMLTVGGVVFDDSQSAHFDQSGFKHIEFIKESDEPYKIEVPNLTFKEIRRLNEQLPRKTGDILKLPDVPDTDVEKYAKIYRYFPAFSETNF